MEHIRPLHSMQLLKHFSHELVLQMVQERDESWPQEDFFVFLHDKTAAVTVIILHDSGLRVSRTGLLYFNEDEKLSDHGFKRFFEVIFL